MPVEGVDYAFPPRPSPASLVAAGKHFAVRYGGPGSSDKQLDPAEAEDLKTHGLWIVANAEGSAGGLAGGFAVGASWARTADAHFKACGMPDDRPIYLSVDFDVTALGWPAVRDALSGAASVIGFARVGVYGGRRAIQWARRDEVAAWFWQTYAWSGGVWEPGNHLEQYRNGVTIGGADCDLNRAMQADYGQWQPGGGNYGPIGGDMTPTEHNWLYNLGSIARGLADGADSVDQVVPDGASGGQHYTLSLAPFWDKVGGAQLGAEAIAAVAKAAAEGANTGASDAVAGLKLGIKLEGSAENTG